MDLPRQPKTSTLIIEPNAVVADDIHESVMEHRADAVCHRCSSMAAGDAWVRGGGVCDVALVSASELNRTGTATVDMLAEQGVSLIIVGDHPDAAPTLPIDTAYILRPFTSEMIRDVLDRVAPRAD